MWAHIFLIGFIDIVSSSETNILQIWENSKEVSTPNDWNRDIKQCRIREVCFDDIQACENKVMWKNVPRKLKNSKEVVVMDDRSFYQASFSQTLTQRKLDKLKEKFCDMTLIRKDIKRGCLILWIPNQCPWKPFTEEDRDFSKDCEVRTIDTKDAGSFPRDCSKGPGWRGALETFMEGDSYKINWASLVKQPACVKFVTLIDKKSKKINEFITTWSDQNFPIEYEKSACNLTIKIKDFWGTCFLVNTKVDCETDADPNTKRFLPDRFNDTQVQADSSSTTTIVGIICGTIVTVVVVIAITLIILKKTKKPRAKREKPKNQEELNDLYGTYYHGVEYNIASDTNPRYNEHGGNADAVVTDENVYYQL